MSYINVIPPIRGRDAQGSGRFGASRGGRRHNGVDFLAEPGEEIKAFFPGVVTKLGYPYSHDLSFRYVQITDDNDFDARYFYVEPSVEIGEKIERDQVLGTLQELPYEGIQQHYHFEVKRNERYYEPITYLCGDIK